MRNSYRLSRDYGKLRELLDRGLMIVCFADCKVDGTNHRDVCVGGLVVCGSGFTKYDFSVRGRLYCSWNPDLIGKIKDYPDFRGMMEMHNIEFIEP